MNTYNNMKPFLLTLKQYEIILGDIPLRRGWLAHSTKFEKSLTCYSRVSSEVLRPGPAPTHQTRTQRTSSGRCCSTSAGRRGAYTSCTLSPSSSPWRVGGCSSTGTTRMTSLAHPSTMTAAQSHPVDTSAPATSIPKYLEIIKRMNTVNSLLTGYLLNRTHRQR